MSLSAVKNKGFRIFFDDDGTTSSNGLCAVQQKSSKIIKLVAPEARDRLYPALITVKRHAEGPRVPRCARNGTRWIQRTLASTFGANWSRYNAAFALYMWWHSLHKWDTADSICQSCIVGKSCRHPRKSKSCGERARQGLFRWIWSIQVPILLKFAVLC